MKKFLVIFFLSFLIVSCGKKEQTETENLELNSSSGNIEIIEEEEIYEPRDFKELSNYELKYEIYTPNATKNLKQKIEDLKNDENIENKFKATYLESFIGDYKNALDEREKLCERNPENTKYCEKVIVSLNSLMVKDTDGDILEDVKVYFDGREIEQDGVDVELEPNFEHRIKYTKEGYLSYFQRISTENKDENLNFMPVLIKAKEQKTTSSDKDLRITTQKFNIDISKNAYKTVDGKTYNGEVNVYFFELGKSENNASVFQLDAFDENGTLLGQSMVTFGMPYITAYDSEGNELEVENFKGKGIIQNTERMPGIDLINVPKNVYLNREQLLEYNIPPFWYLQKNGTWIAGKMKILDEKGNYEFIYND